VTAASHSLTVRVPLAIRRRGGRKVVVTPEGEVACASTLPRTRVDSTLVKALARAHRWKRLLENGTYASISELAKAEKIDRGYLGRILQLTLPAPGRCSPTNHVAGAGRGEDVDASTASNAKICGTAKHHVCATAKNSDASPQPNAKLLMTVPVIMVRLRNAVSVAL
jgi:hypothetical protein